MFFFCWSDLSTTSRCFSLTYKPPADGSDLPPPNDHPIWTLPGINRYSVLWDSLRGLDLGPTGHVNGNSLQDLLELPSLGPNKEARLQWVRGNLKQAYDVLEVENRLDYLTLSMVTDPKSPGTCFPFLKAKANENKYVCACLFLLLQDPLVHDPADDYCVYRLPAVTYLCRFYAIMDSPSYFLTREEQQVAEEAVHGFLQSYSWLNQHALRNNRMRWPITIKFHYFKHEANLLGYLNPKHGSTYRGEHFVGKLAKIGLSCSYGKPAYAISPFLVQKLRLLAKLEARRGMENEP